MVPVGLLALIAQLGGIAVLMGAVLFVANRVNIGKFLVIIRNRTRTLYHCITYYDRDMVRKVVNIKITISHGLQVPQ